MKIEKIILYMLLAICTIDLSTPIVVYGTQIVALAIISLILIVKYNRFQRKSTFISITFSLILIFISYVQSFYLQYTSMIWLYTFRTIYWLMVFTMLKPALKEIPKKTFKEVIQGWIVIYSAFLFYQFASFYFLNTIIDYSLLLGGEPSRMFNNVGLRASGLTSEPSIYSGIMIALLVLLYLYNGNKNNLITFLGIASMLCTLSTLAVFLAGSFMILTSLKKINIKAIIAIIVFFMASSIYLLQSLTERIEKYSSGTDVSNNIKADVVNGIMTDQNIFLLGYGLIGNSPGAPVYYQALYDLTYFGNLIVIFGVPIGLIIGFISLMLILRSNFTKSEKIIIFLVLIKITIPNFIFFYLLIILLISINNSRKGALSV